MSKFYEFTECDDAQVNWGSGDDPRKVMTIGARYEIEDVDVHNWHTLYSFKGIDGQFNSVCFEEVKL